MQDKQWMEKAKLKRWKKKKEKNQMKQTLLNDDARGHLDNR